MFALPSSSTGLETGAESTNNFELSNFDSHYLKAVTLTRGCGVLSSEKQKKSCSR